MKETKIVFTVFTIIAVFSLAGCTFSKEGVGIGFNPANNPEPIENPQPVIVVGTVSALRRYAVSDFEKDYQQYQKYAERFHPQQAALLSREKFQESFAGWTKLKVLNVPLIVGLYTVALVPVRLVETIGFSSDLGTVLFQESGDLLAARSNADGAFVIDRILCRDEGSEYYECAKAYDKGIFHAETGVELDAKFYPKESGRRIDVISYLSINPISGIQITNPSTDMLVTVE